MKKISIILIASLVLVSCTFIKARVAKPGKIKILPKAEMPVFWNPEIPIDKRVDELVSHLTLEEKVSQMLNNAPAIERLGIPAYKWWNECLHGVLAKNVTVFPQAIGLGATWDSKLIYDVATATSDEARAKHHDAVRSGETGKRDGLTFWSPNINIFRDPRWGRGQETYGEDPYLMARLGVEFVKGLQGDDARYLKLVSTPKHFAVHSGPDPDRHHFNAMTSDQNLWETFLPAFEACVREAGAYSVMGAYNRFRGEPCCASQLLLVDILRNKWGFKGYVVSDCGAIEDIFFKHHVANSPEEASAMGVKKGCDLCCGDIYTSLVNAVKLGLVTEGEIDVCVKRLFEARMRLGMFDPPEMVPYGQIPMEKVDCLAHRKLAIDAGRESIVLLKNENNLLPLNKNIKKIAVIGPNADSVNELLGNYNGTPTKATTPLEGIIKKVHSQTEVVYVKGCEIDRAAELVPIPATALIPPNGKKGRRGLQGEYFNNMNLKGKPKVKRVDSRINFDWGEGSPIRDVIPEDRFSVRWTGKIKPPVSGEYTLGLESDDGVRLYVNNKRLINDWHDHGTKLTSATLMLEAKQTYDIKIEYYDNGIYANVKLMWATPLQTPTDEAIELAKASDVVLAFMGISTGLENEEWDRTYIGLPEVQENLLKAIQATGKPIVLVLLNGGPVSVPWADENIPAIVEAWYPGEEGGTAIADVLFGDYNPAGRLPVTVYQSLDQVLPFTDYDMEKGRTYKYFRGEPLYAFGYGLSYTTFDYSDLVISTLQVKGDENITISVKVKNSGVIDGDEVIQLYLSHTTDKYTVPIRSLKGFERIYLEAGEEKSVEFKLSAADYSVVNPDGKKAVEPGKIIVSVGGGQPTGDSIMERKKVKTLQGSFEVIGNTRALD